MVINVAYCEKRNGSLIQYLDIHKYALNTCLEDVSIYTKKNLTSLKVFINTFFYLILKFVEFLCPKKSEVKHHFNQPIYSGKFLALFLPLDISNYFGNS